MPWARNKVGQDSNDSRFLIYDFFSESSPKRLCQFESRFLADIPTIDFFIPETNDFFLYRSFPNACLDHLICICTNDPFNFFSFGYSFVHVAPLGEQDPIHFTV